ncbi:serine/threonine-protein kinase [Laspinema sp. D1]|uniref:Serine/threonine-protein kinase n=1 Tax=Laspinema palackyanum D2a TaxID=2953684 RepID=A0ABT2N2D6_9CYAN|nr:serine/threonine-protein kinase [Laspinema sp. D2a]
MVWPNGYQLQSRDYVIEKVLGQGGFGITYKARHLNLDEHFVIKTPHEHLKDEPDYPKYVDRFIKEAQRIVKVCKNPHPHIVRVFDLFQEGDTHCMIMDFIPGETLWQWVHRRDVLLEATAVRYIRQIGEALQVVHQAGLVHRDANPGNIMFRGDSAVLIDFGIAGEIVPVTVTSKHFGNDAFAPLEQRDGSREPTVDIYTLSASLYYSVTGQPPQSSLNRKLYEAELVPPKQLVPSLSDTVNEAVLKGMELYPQNRPQTMNEWLSLLQTPIPTTMTVSPRYQKLQQLLAAGKWREADEETARVMLQVAGREQEGWLNDDSINQFPCEDFRQIDGLWVQYSNGRFGFSVQKRIWQECGGKDDYETGCRLGDRVGWRRKEEWLDYDELTFSTVAPPGHLPGKMRIQEGFRNTGAVQWWGGGGWCGARW